MSRTRGYGFATIALLIVLVAGACGSRTPEVADADVSGDILLVLGRSVMTGWVEHWGGSSSEPVVWQGRTVVFREIEGPPGIADGAISAMADATPGSTVLFKFCFVDFNGGDYERELDDHLEAVSRVADAAAERGLHLIVGNALPKVASETTPELVAEHQEFGRRLEELAQERRAAGESVRVLDLNGTLVDGSGALRDGYAVSRDDSHLTEAAYDALDRELLAVLEED